VSLHVERGARIAIVGDNGQGKTTLLRTLAGDLPTQAGSVWRAPNLDVSVYAQHVYQSLHPDDTVRGHLERTAAKDVLRQAILDLAGAFLFRGDDVEKPVRVLSGGERARLCLAGMLLAKRSVLLLDEPTNHLDFETVEALGAALRDFAGTVVFISHDRTFVNMVATEIVEVDQGRVRVVAGTYADYVEALERRARGGGGGAGERDRAKRAAPAPKPAAPAAPARAASPSAPAATPAAPESHADRKRRKNEMSRLEGALKKAEARLADLEAKRSALHAQIEKDGATYRPELFTQIHELERDIAHVEQEWLETGERMQELAADPKAASES
jgi:ATP-binding cassette subfamily F protein 3